MTQSHSVSLSLFCSHCLTCTQMYLNCFVLLLVCISPICVCYFYRCLHTYVLDRCYRFFWTMCTYKRDEHTDIRNNTMCSMQHRYLQRTVMKVTSRTSIAIINARLCLVNMKICLPNWNILKFLARLCLLLRTWNWFLYLYHCDITWYMHPDMYTWLPLYQNIIWSNNP